MSQTCQEQILRTLYLEEPMGFEAIIEKCKHYSRGTVNKHLSTLYKEGLVKQEKGRGRRRYYLNEKAKEEAARMLILEDVTNADSPQDLLEEIQKLAEVAKHIPSDSTPFFSCFYDLKTKVLALDTKTKKGKSCTC